MEFGKEKEISLKIEQLETTKLPIRSKYNIFFNLKASDLNEISGKKILAYLNYHSDNDINLRIVNALPPCIFDFKDRIIAQELGLIKSCFNCENLFRTNSLREVIFCNGKKGRDIDYYDSLEALYSDFVESNKYASIPAKCKNCELTIEGQCSYGCIYRKDNFELLYDKEDLSILKFQYDILKLRKITKDNFKLSRIFIFLTYKCSNDCLHCLVGDKGKWIDSDRAFLEDMINKYAKQFPLVDFCGGEPTLSKYLPELITLSKNKRLQVHMFSNGRRFKYKEFAKHILDTGVDLITVPIHTHISAKHNLITQREGSFQEMVKGIENLQSLNFKGLHLMIIVHKQNYQDLLKTVNFVLSFRPILITFVSLVLGGNAVKNFRMMSIKLSSIVPYLEEAFQFLIEKKSNFFVHTFPLCLFKQRFWVYFLNDRYKLSVTNFLFPQKKNICSYAPCGVSLTKRCVDCQVKKLCPGTWETYYYFYGDKEFIPQKSTGMEKFYRDFVN